MLRCFCSCTPCSCCVARDHVAVAVHALLHVDVALPLLMVPSLMLHCPCMRCPCSRCAALAHVALAHDALCLLTLLLLTMRCSCSCSPCSCRLALPVHALLVLMSSHRWTEQLNGAPTAVRRNAAFQCASLQPTDVRGSTGGQTTRRAVAGSVKAHDTRASPFRRTVAHTVLFWSTGEHRLGSHDACSRATA